jgi:hypothetical protein
VVEAVTPATARSAYLRVVRRSTATPEGCLVYGGYRDRKGYSRVRVGAAIEYGHRVAVVAMTCKPIPEGMVVDHTCRNRACVRYSHLEVVTPLLNTARGLSWGAHGARKKLEQS